MDKQAIGFFIKELNLSNVEKRESKNILSSSNQDMYFSNITMKKSFDEHETPIKLPPGVSPPFKNHMMDPEDEDAIHGNIGFVNDF